MVGFYNTRNKSILRSMFVQNLQEIYTKKKFSFEKVMLKNGLRGSPAINMRLVIISFFLQLNDVFSH